MAGVIFIQRDNVALVLMDRPSPARAAMGFNDNIVALLNSVALTFYIFRYPFAPLLLPSRRNSSCARAFKNRELVLAAAHWLGVFKSTIAIRCV